MNNLKEEYHVAEAKLKPHNYNTAFTLEMILKLKEMAEHDVYPDGTFGDDACIVWSLFR